MCSFFYGGSDSNDHPKATFLAWRCSEVHVPDMLAHFRGYGTCIFFVAVVQWL